MKLTFLIIASLVLFGCSNTKTENITKQTVEIDTFYKSRMCNCNTDYRLFRGYEEDRVVIDVYCGLKSIIEVNINDTTKYIIEYKGSIERIISYNPKDHDELADSSWATLWPFYR